MPSPSPREINNYDLYLSYDGRKVGLLLHRDEAGNVSWFPSLAPDLQPQFETGTYGYEQVPSQTDIPLSFEIFSLGAGFQDDPNETPQAGARGYSHSRGVDGSEGDRAYLSHRQVTTTGIAAQPVKFFQAATLGFFVIAAEFIYEWTGAAWTERDDNGVGNDYTDIIEFNGVLYAAAGSSTAYTFSTDGITWTTSTLSGAAPRPAYWATRDDNLWYVNANGAVATTTDGQNGGVAWSAEDAVGSTSEKVRGMRELDGNLYIFKEEGIYRYTGTATEDVWLGGINMRRTTNGFQPFVWVDGLTYVPYGDRLMQFDQATSTLQFVFPTNAMRGHPELNGQISGVAGDARWLFFAFTNAVGDVYFIQGNPYHNGGAGEWHSIGYVAASTIEASILLGPTTDFVNTNNPTWVYGIGSSASYQTRPRVGFRSEDDANVTFETGPGRLYSGWNGYGSRGFTKFLNSGDVVGTNLSATETYRLLYEIDESGSEVQILEATESGKSSANVTNEVEFARIRSIHRLISGVNTETPIAHAGVLHATPNPPRRHAWQFIVDVADDLEMVGGGRSRWSGQDLEAFLFGSVNKRVTLTDRQGRSFLVKVQNVVGIGGSESGEPQRTQVFTNEISALV